jgi:hypothetical protein
MPSWLVELLRREWFLGALGGVVATVIGFLLAIMWDLYKMRTEGQERTQVALVAITEELALNKKLIERNVALLRKDLEGLPEKKSVVQPLSLLKTGFWDVAKVSLSRNALRPDKLLRLRNVLALAEQVNEEIRSRETYRLHNGAMSNFHDHLGIYDGALLETLEELSSALTTYERDDRPKPE